MFPLFIAYKRYLDDCRGGLHINVRLGSPRRQDCRGLGICEMQTVTTPTGKVCGCWATAFLRIDRPTERLLLHFVNESMSTAARRRHFAGDSFTVDLAFALPAPIAESLGLAAGKHRITPGHYPTLDDGEFTTLSLRMAETNIVRLPVLRAAA